MARGMLVSTTLSVQKSSFFIGRNAERMDVLERPIQASRRCHRVAASPSTAIGVDWIELRDRHVDVTESQAGHCRATRSSRIECRMTSTTIRHRQSERRGTSSTRHATSSSSLLVPAAMARTENYTSDGTAGTDEHCYICASLVADSVDELIKGIALAKLEGADVVELRLDLIKDFNGNIDLARLLENRGLPAVVTYRPTWENGQYEGDEESRQEILRRAVELGADFIDVEAQVAESFISKHKSLLDSARPATRVIVSSHNYECTPSSEDLAALAERIVSTGADIVKIATMASTITDTCRIFELLTKSQMPMIALSMGPSGQISRLLAPKFGGFLTFGSLGKGRESAPGQLTVAELANTYRLKRQDRDSKVFGLIGKPVGHSKGTVIHNGALSRVGVNGIYVPFLVDDVREFLDAFPSSDFGGFSVTIPHKEAALRCCDEVDPVAMAIGAVNTMVRTPDQKLIGYNSDWLAAISAVEDGVRLRENLKTGGDAEDGGKSPLAGRIVVVVGAGGAGKGLVYGAKAAGAHVIIANRNHQRAVELASSSGATAMLLSEIQKEGIVERLKAEKWENEGLDDKEPVLINTTSVGMHPNVDDSPIPMVALKGYGVVFDAIYTPLETRLLREAKSEGATVVSGLEMFVRQAIVQFAHFTGKQVQVDVMRELLLASL